MVLPWVDAVIGVATTALLAAGAVYAEALTGSAGVVAALFGSIIVVSAGFAYLALLVLFVVAASLATRYGLEEKTRRRVQEGTRGERGVSNVLAHIALPTGIALTSVLPVGLGGPETSALFAAAMSFGAADTFASEFGVLQGRAISILTFRTVPAGANGGISALGTVWAAVGAGTTALVGFALFAAGGLGTSYFARWAVVVAIAGFLACQVDSVLGETLENRGYLTKGGTNFLAMASAILLAGAFWSLLPGVP